MAAAGTVTIKVVPDLSEFQDAISEQSAFAALMRRAAQDLLLTYGEWLDSQGIIRSEAETTNDSRSYEQLARDFLNRISSETAQ
ncbi:hypothetical protein PP713_13980 [Mycobacterium sp. CSUR Q5927]|nr:hypothetical protein [Mycobacterium sp. CSUR Q5927]